MSNMMMAAIALALPAKFEFTETIAADFTNYNVKARAIAAGWDQAAKLIATVTINSGVVVSSNSTSVYAFDTGSGFPAGSYLVFTNKGHISGMGGAGGAVQASGTAFPGGAGGPALNVQLPTTFDNTLGSIEGGGGGGGSANGSSGTAGGGGGRTGRTASSGGGAGPWPWGVGAASGSFASGGAGGGGGGGGAGGTTGAGAAGTDAGGSGGGGGGWGSAGGAGRSSSGLVGAGGAGGAAIVGNSNITWVNTGARYGSIS